MSGNIPKRGTAISSVTEGRGGYTGRGRDRQLPVINPNPEQENFVANEQARMLARKKIGEAILTSRRGRGTGRGEPVRNTSPEQQVRNAANEQASNARRRRSYVDGGRRITELLTVNRTEKTELGIPASKPKPEQQNVSGTNADSRIQRLDVRNSRIRRTIEHRANPIDQTADSTEKAANFVEQPVQIEQALDRIEKAAQIQQDRIDAELTQVKLNEAEEKWMDQYLI